jgi:serine/threonine-protein kinase
LSQEKGGAFGVTGTKERLTTSMAHLDNPGGTAVGLGEQLDHYRLESVVANGRAAATFRATDLLTNRTVALVVPNPEIEADPVLSERFQREDEIDKVLDHPGLIKLIEKRGREPGSGHSYLVREWFDGISLRALVSAGKLSPERAIRITASICEIVDYVHGHRVILRDLEPDHILVGENDQVKVIHVGVTSKLGARRLTFTKLSQVIGASLYISPEELLGKHADVRSDVYSIGVMLYEMVVGQLPNPGPRIDDRLSSYPVPPRELDPGISPQLQEVIYRALERDPQNRYATARELARDLTHLDQVGVIDRPELHEWREEQISPIRKLVFYLALALIPIAIFALMLYFAKR